MWAINSWNIWCFTAPPPVLLCTNNIYWIFSFLSKQSVTSAPSKRPQFLSPNWIFELVQDSESDEAGAPSDSSSEDERERFWRWASSVTPATRLPNIQQHFLQCLWWRSSSDGARSTGPNTIHFTVYTALWPSEKCCTHLYKGPQREGKKGNEEPHINYSSSPLSIFMTYFAEIITLLEVETKTYYHNHHDRLGEGVFSLPDMTEAEMLEFLVVTIQTGHGLWNRTDTFTSLAFCTSQTTRMNLT